MTLSGPIFNGRPRHWPEPDPMPEQDTEAKLHAAFEAGRAQGALIAGEYWKQEYAKPGHGALATSPPAWPQPIAPCPAPSSRR